MLVLTRHEGDGVTITLPGGAKIHVYLLAVEGTRARLGFKAPACVDILRDECGPSENYWTARKGRHEDGCGCDGPPVRVLDDAEADLPPTHDLGGEAGGA